MQENKKDYGMEVIDFYIKSKTSNAVLKEKFNQIITLESQLLTYSYYSKYGRYISYLLVILGFSLWYLKVQRHHDKILKVSAD